MDFAVDWTVRVDFEKLRRERQKSLNEQMKKHKLDGLLLFKAEHLRYMTGYRPLWWSISFLTRNAGLMAVDKEPIVKPGLAANLANYSDPLPQSLVLTAIVIGFATTALFLVVLLALRGLSGGDHVDGSEEAP